jgi:hypothetical protein
LCPSQKPLPQMNKARRISQPSLWITVLLYPGPQASLSLVSHRRVMAWPYQYCRAVCRTTMLVMRCAECNPTSGHARDAAPVSLIRILRAQGNVLPQPICLAHTDTAAPHRLIHSYRYLGNAVCGSHDLITRETPTPFMNRPAT